MRVHSAAAFGSSIFLLCLRKKDCAEQLSVDIAYSADSYCLKVMNIKSGGIVSNWNRQTTHVGKSIYPGDHIVSVNGYMEATAMLNQCLRSTVLKMLIRPLALNTDNIRHSPLFVRCSLGDSSTFFHNQGSN